MFWTSSPFLPLRLFTYGDILGLWKRDDNLGVEEERSFCIREAPEPNTSYVYFVLPKPQNGGNNIGMEFTSY
jgi:hypothetical protein